jgi:hypothetical protein
MKKFELIFVIIGFFAVFGLALFLAAVDEQVRDQKAVTETHSLNID